MAYDEQLATRIRKVLARRKGFSKKRMFGGMAFFLGGNMCCGGGVWGKMNWFFASDPSGPKKRSRSGTQEWLT